MVMFPSVLNPPLPEMNTDAGTPFASRTFTKFTRPASVRRRRSFGNLEVIEECACGDDLCEGHHEPEKSSGPDEAEHDSGTIYESAPLYPSSSSQTSSTLSHTSALAAYTLPPSAKLARARAALLLILPWSRSAALLCELPATGKMMERKKKLDRLGRARKVRWADYTAEDDEAYFAASEEEPTQVALTRNELRGWRRRPSNLRKVDTIPESVCQSLEDDINRWRHECTLSSSSSDESEEDEAFSLALLEECMGPEEEPRPRSRAGRHTILEAELPNTEKMLDEGRVLGFQVTVTGPDGERVRPAFAGKGRSLSSHF